MPSSDKDFIPNQVFVGLPSKNVRPKYEKVFERLKMKFPTHFAIVGRDDGQSADDLFTVIKNRIDSSSFAIFDATRGNPNVSLEYGYAEGRGIERAIYLSTHKGARTPDDTPIISDLIGRRRVQYKNKGTLVKELSRFCKSHPYTVRYEKALKAITKGLKKGPKKSLRTLTLKIIHELDGRELVRRREVIQNVQAKGYSESEIDEALRQLHHEKILNCSPGRMSNVTLT